MKKPEQREPTREELVEFRKVDPEIPTGRSGDYAKARIKNR